jgi:uncharacterized membrane protein YccC
VETPRLGGPIRVSAPDGIARAVTLGRLGQVDVEFAGRVGDDPVRADQLPSRQRSLRDRSRAALNALRAALFTLAACLLLTAAGV